MKPLRDIGDDVAGCILLLFWPVLALVRLWKCPWKLEYKFPHFLGLFVMGLAIVIGLPVGRILLPLAYRKLLLWAGGFGYVAGLAVCVYLVFYENRSSPVLRREEG